MKIQARCPSCLKKYSVSDSAIGRKATCKDCGAKFVVRNIDEEELEYVLKEDTAPTNDEFAAVIPPEQSTPTKRLGRVRSKKPETPGCKSWDEEGDGPIAGRIRATVVIAIGAAFLWSGKAWLNKEGSVPIMLPTIGSIALPFGIVGMFYSKLLTHDPNNCPTYHRVIVLVTSGVSVAFLIYVLFGMYELF